MTWPEIPTIFATQVNFGNQKAKDSCTCNFRWCTNIGILSLVLIMLYLSASIYLCCGSWMKLYLYSCATAH